MRSIPTGSMILTSDDVFDYMLDLRALNDGVDMRREQMFADYNDLRREKFQMHGMKDYDRLKQVSAARHTANPRWHAARCPPMCAPAPMERAHWACSASAFVRTHCICWMSLKTVFHPSGSRSLHGFA